MPTARELLEQADALMRKNRGGDGEIPVLTDAVLAPSAAIPATQSDIPVLTDQVEEVVIDFAPLPEQPAVVGPLLEGDPSDWLVMDTIDPATHSVTGKAPDTLAVVPPITLKAPELTAKDFEVPAPVTLKAAGSAPTPPPAGSEPSAATAPLSAADMPGAPPFAEDDHEARAGLVVDAAATDEAHWRVLAEQISMQVLQRIDLFTDTGLKEQLAEHLQPIVERAGTELVAAINHHVGKLLRAYVAEAIEREIAQWRKEHH